MAKLPKDPRPGAVKFHPRVPNQSRLMCRRLPLRLSGVAEYCRDSRHAILEAVAIGRRVGLPGENGRQRRLLKKGAQHV